MRIFLAIVIAGMLSGCLTPTKVMNGLSSLDVLSSKAATAYSQCVSAPKPNESAVCTGFHLCITLTAKAGQLGAKAISDAADSDPWMRGPSAIAFSNALPVTTNLCAAAGIKP